MSTVLEIDGVWKAYRRRREQRWALRDVSLRLEAGRSAALVGHNGAGKSTLLRLASGLSRPTRGAIAVADDTASVLNLGTSFDLELTGAENAYTAALVGGHRRRAAREVVQGALAFAELEEYAAEPVRTYSEGMKLRLAFGVLAQRRPRLLIVDEVLSVGDAAFQRKARERIAELRAEGTSLLLASHSREEVLATCQDAVWLHRGEVRVQGTAEAVMDEYENAVLAGTRTPVGAPEGALRLGENRFGTQQVTVDSVAAPERVRTGAPLEVALTLTAHGEPVAEPVLAVAIRRARDGEVLADMTSDAGGLALGTVDGAFTVALTVERLELAPGEYALDVGVYERGWDHAYDYHHAAYPLVVEGPPAGKGVLAPRVRWRRGG